MYTGTIALQLPDQPAIVLEAFGSEDYETLPATVAAHVVPAVRAAADVTGDPDLRTAADRFEAPEFSAEVARITDLLAEDLALAVEADGMAYRSLPAPPVGWFVFEIA